MNTGQSPILGGEVVHMVVPWRNAIWYNVRFTTKFSSGDSSSTRKRSAVYYIVFIQTNIMISFTAILFTYERSFYST
jgi:hypothetical protein